MAYNSPLLEKSLYFAARIVKLYQYLSKEKKEIIISKQIIRSLHRQRRKVSPSFRHPLAEHVVIYYLSACCVLTKCIGQVDLNMI